MQGGGGGGGSSFFVAGLLPSSPFQLPTSWPFRDTGPSCSAGSVSHLFSNEWNPKAFHSLVREEAGQPPPPPTPGRGITWLIFTSKECSSPLLLNRLLWRIEVPWGNIELQGEREAGSLDWWRITFPDLSFLSDWQASAHSRHHTHLHTACPR